MKKKIVSALLLSAMIAGMCAVSPISAADEEKVTLGTPKKEPVTLSADANTAPKDLLKDVEKDNDKWYFGAMKTTYNMSLIKGKRLPSGEDAWLPNEKTTRAELATIIRRYAGVSDEEIKGMGDKVTFNDTKTHWA
ncbi:MAG: hypothetical protein HFE30_06265, partial [Clostridiales bacterium]|nr:hypothetical protein [Clostridiales bacterium]